MFMSNRKDHLFIRNAKAYYPPVPPLYPIPPSLKLTTNIRNSTEIFLPKHSGLREMSSKAISPCETMAPHPTNCKAYLKEPNMLQIWAATSEDVPTNSAPNENSDQPAHTRSLVRVFIVRMKKLWITGYPKCVQWRFRLDCTNVRFLPLRAIYINWGILILHVFQFNFESVANIKVLLTGTRYTGYTFRQFAMGDNVCDFLFA